MLLGVRDVFRWTRGKDGFDLYFANVPAQARSGVPTADEARKDYARTAWPYRHLL